MLVKLDPQQISQTHVTFQGFFLGLQVCLQILGRPTARLVGTYYDISSSNAWLASMFRIESTFIWITCSLNKLTCLLKNQWLETNLAFRNRPFFKWTFLSFLGC